MVLWSMITMIREVMRVPSRDRERETRTRLGDYAQDGGGQHPGCLGTAPEDESQRK